MSFQKGEIVDNFFFCEKRFLKNLSFDKNGNVKFISKELHYTGIRSSTEDGYKKCQDNWTCSDRYLCQ